MQFQQLRLMIQPDRKVHIAIRFVVKKIYLDSIHTKQVKDSLATKPKKGPKRKG